MKQARRELTALRVTYYKDRNQQPSVTSGGGDGTRPLADADVDTDANRSNDEEKNSNDFPPTETAFHEGLALGSVKSSDTAARENSESPR